MYKLIKKIIPAVLFLVVFCLYIYTAPKVATNYADSNELIAASYTLGVPHPPGYPIFMLVGKLFSFIPIGEIAFRYSLMASFLGTLTVVFVYLSIVKIYEINKEKDSGDLLIKFVPAIAAALSLTCAYLFWLYSLVPEVFCISNFLTSLIIYTGICWYKNKRQENPGNSQDKYPFILTFLFGLAFVSQQVTAFLFPPLVSLFFILDKKIFIPSRKWLKLLFAVFLSQLPIIYLPIASFTHPIIDYGNATTFKNLMDHLTRRIYARASPTGSAYLPTEWTVGTRISEFFYFFKTLIDQYTPLLVLVGLIGFLFIVFLFFKKQWKDPRLFAGIMFLFSGPLLMSWLAFDHSTSPGYNVMGAMDRMYLLGIIAFGVIIGIGMQEILIFVKKSRYLSMPVLAAIFILLPLMLFKANFNVINKNNFYLGEDFAYNLFVNIEPNAIFFTTGDMPSFAAYYYKYVEGERKDVTIVPFSLRSWAVEQLHKREPDLWDTDSKNNLVIYRDIIRKNIGKRPIYFTGIPTDKMLELGVGDNPYVLSPRGLITEAGKTFDPKEEINFWEKMRWRNSKDINSYRDWYVKELFEQYIVGHYNSFSHYLIRGYYDLAEKELRMMIETDPYHNATESSEYRWRVYGKKNREVKPFALKSQEEYLKLAVNAVKGNQIGIAIAYYDLLSEMNPDNISYLYSLGSFYESLNSFPDALREYRKILDIDPQNKEAKEKIMIVEEKAKKTPELVF